MAEATGAEGASPATNGNGNGPGVKVQQEQTMRWIALAAIVALAVIGYGAVNGKIPETGAAVAVITAVVTCLTNVVGQVVAAKAALSAPSAPKTQ